MKAPTLKFFAGAALLALGCAHFFHERQTPIDAGNVQVHGVESVLGPSLPQIDMARFRRVEGEPLLAYVKRANDLLHTSTYSCFATDFSLSWAERLLSASIGEEQFEWGDGLFGQELICGLCSQRAITLAMIFRENNVDDAWAYGLNGHVVVKFKDDTGNHYLVDPDYGVSPYPLLSEPKSFEQLVRDKYSRFNNTSDVVRIITSLEDNSANRSYDWAKTVLTARNDLYLKADCLAAGVALLGAVLTAQSILLAGMRMRPRCRSLEAANNV